MHLVLQHSIVYFLQQYSSKSTIATIIALSKTRKPLNTFCLKAAPWPTNTPACQPGNCIAQAGIRTIRKTGSLTQLSIHDTTNKTPTPATNTPGTPMAPTPLTTRTAPPPHHKYLGTPAACQQRSAIKALNSTMTENPRKSPWMKMLWLNTAITSRAKEL